MRDTYQKQVSLLARTLPHIAKEEIFLLKGGTAINLFYRDLPRLSIDIDLTYLPVKNREDSLREIDEVMERIVSVVGNGIEGARAHRITGGGGGATRAQVSLSDAAIKIETSPMTRGVVHEPEMRSVTEAVEEAFGFVEMKVVSFEDLFGGKLHVALCLNSLT